MPLSKEITIIGGGLAGLTLGVLLRRRGIPVTLHEAGRYPRHRVCGEFICGLDMGAMERLGLPEFFVGAVQGQTTAWYYYGECVYEQILPCEAIGISRYLLDQRLATAFQDGGGELREGSRVNLSQPYGPGTVFASGRRATESDWLGLKFHVRGLECQHDLELHLGRQCYIGISQVEDGIHNFCGLFKKQPGLRAAKNDLPFAYMKACGLGYLVDQLKQADLDTASITGVSHLGYAPARPAGDRLQLGDVAGLIPPFTGNGMSIAMEGAAIAAEPVSAYAQGQIEWPEAVRVINQQTHRRFAIRQKIARSLHPFLINRHAQRGLRLLARHSLLPFGLLFRLTH